MAGVMLDTFTNISFSYKQIKAHGNEVIVPTHNLDVNTVSFCCEGAQCPHSKTLHQDLLNGTECHIGDQIANHVNSSTRKLSTIHNMGHFWWTLEVRTLLRDKQLSFSQSVDQGGIYCKQHHHEPPKNQHLELTPKLTGFQNVRGGTDGHKGKKTEFEMYNLSSVAGEELSNYDCQGIFQMYQQFVKKCILSKVCNKTRIF